MNNRNTRAGFSLLITLILMTVLLGVSASLLNVVLKQYQLSGISAASEMAFQAANAGIECGLYHDYLNYNNTPPDSVFDVDPAPATQLRIGRPGASTNQIDCFGVSSEDVLALPPTNDSDVRSEEEQRFEYSWGVAGGEVCTKISVYKFYSDSASVPVEIDTVPYRSDCPEDSICTVIKSRGYNTTCANIANNPRTVERELVRVY